MTLNVAEFVKSKWQEQHCIDVLLDRFVLLKYESGDVYLPVETYDIIKSLHTSNPSIIRHGALGLTELPYIGRWHGLIRIELMNNKICELPQSPDCPKLKVLLLQGNVDLMDIPDSFFDHMPLLQLLDLSYTSIRDLPPSVFNLIKLEKFYLRGCDIFMELPPQIGQLRNLEELDLDGTLITHLPKEIQKLIKLQSLTVCFDGYHHVLGHGKKGKQISNSTIIPPGVISNLTRLNYLSINVDPEDERWNENVNSVLMEIFGLRNLQRLSMYVPKADLLEFIPAQKSINFRLVVGHHMRPLISRVTPELETKFKHCDYSIKFVNGVNVPNGVKMNLGRFKVLYLDRHMTIKSLSDFDLRNLWGLEGCILAECNEMETIVNGRNSPEGPAFLMLKFLSVFYMKNLRSICKGSSPFFLYLKSIALHTCPMLTTIFTLDSLNKLSFLEEIIVEDCPKVTTLISHATPEQKQVFFLPKLRIISLLYLPELVNIFNGLHVGHVIEDMMFYYSPRLQSLSKSELSSKSLKIIKGESIWWEALKWDVAEWGDDGRPKFYEQIFSPINEEADMMNQLAALQETQLNEYHSTTYQENSVSSARRVPVSNQENSHWLNLNTVFSLPQGIDEVKFPAYSSMVETQVINSDHYETLSDQSQIGAPPDADSSLTVVQKQKFTIKTIFTEWGYDTQTTKVIVVGSFLCHPSDSAWACMFGDVEVPVEIIQDGVICCEAPPLLPGKVTLCITSGNRESCSEVREFEYRDKTNGCTRCTQSETAATRSPEELLLLVRLGHVLLSASTIKNDNIESGIPLIEQKADDDSWSHIIEGLLVGSGTSTSTVDWLLEELLKDKLQQWLSCRSKEKDEETGCSLSKKEQGIIYLVAGLGFEWALNPILTCGVNINFRDINGWTALHWAARFGREKMVASLIASGAFAGAVTDPTSQDPLGKTAACMAAGSGHKGLAGYLSEVALTSHLSSLTLEESELSKSSAELEADMAVYSVSKENIAASQDQASLKDTLAAVRNVTQAAARIQSAFRAHSFGKQIEREAAASARGIETIPEISAMSKLAFRNSHNYNSSALLIQKTYRGWKVRKDFLALHQKAHVRGYQVRKHYDIVRAVGIWDKVVLRWRRKGVGLRGFRQAMDINENEDKDILEVFRKQKMDVKIEEAVSLVLSMVDSPDAHEQYRRMLEKYRQAKAELVGTSDEASLFCRRCLIY